MLNKIVIILTTILLLSNCSVDKKFVKLFKEGYTQEKPFKVEIPFEYRLGLLIIKVEINGKMYDFVLDSGGINIISKELAETLESKDLFSKNIGGHQGKRQPMDFTKIKEISIGGVKFEDTPCGIGDFNQSLELSCIGLDGMIGSNLMRLAVWRIDFKDQIITITNTKESLSFEAITKQIPFYTDPTHQPYCDLKINGVEERNVNIDLGSVGGFSVSYGNYEKIQREVSKNKKAIQHGYYGSGYYGFGKIDSTYYLQVNKLSTGEIELENQILKFSKSASPTIGTSFFKNYHLVMNWNDKEILLTPHTDYDNQKFIDNGITLNKKDGALRIASIIKESEAELLGIQLGDKIIQIDGKDYTDITEEEYCDFILQNNWNNPRMNIVVSRGGEQLSFDLNKYVIIE